MYQTYITTTRSGRKIAVAYVRGVGVDFCGCSWCLGHPHSVFECSCEDADCG